MRYISILFFTVLSSCYISDTVAPDQEVWDYARPRAVGLSDESLLGINARINIGEFQGVNGLIIIKEEHLVFENYFRGLSRSMPQSIGSGSLMFTLAAIAVAEDKRLLFLNDPISKYLTEYEDIFQDNPQKQDITIEHLLTHKSGFAWNASIEPFSQLNDLNQMKSSDDWGRYILERPLEAPPGLRFNLNTSSGVLLTLIIEEASGQDFESFLRENILEPLTISSFSIETDPQGNYNGGDGITISLLDWTKLAYLFLNDGLWKSRVIINPGFIEDAFTIQSNVSGTYNIGYIWWLFGDDYSDAFGASHNEIFFLPGELGQHIYIIPSKNMIVSIFADNLLFGFNNPSLNLFTEVSYTFQ
jgi:CubicO group peptidase (beta-lactamase class C family)